MSIFHERLKDLRINSGLTQKTLAEALQLGGKQQIFNYEKGLSEPNIDILNQVAQYFNVSVDYLTGNSDYPSFEHEQLQLSGLDKREAEITFRINTLISHEIVGPAALEAILKFETMVKKYEGLISKPALGAVLDFGGYASIEQETECISEAIARLANQARRGILNKLQELHNEIERSAEFEEGD